MNNIYISVNAKPISIALAILAIVLCIKVLTGKVTVITRNGNEMSGGQFLKDTALLLLDFIIFCGVFCILFVLCLWDMLREKYVDRKRNNS